MKLELLQHEILLVLHVLRDATIHGTADSKLTRELEEKISIQWRKKDEKVPEQVEQVDGTTSAVRTDG